MNIYSYLRSPDIAAHCEKTGHVFNPLEMAVIVALSNKTMKEKHSAWREIIAAYPDMPIRSSNCFKAQDSLHEYLRELIRCEERGLVLFYDADYGSDHVAVFRPYTVRNRHDHSDDLGCYFTVEEAWKAIRDSSDDWIGDRISHVIIYKDHMMHDCEADDQEEVWLNCDGEVIYCDGRYKHFLDWPDELDMIFIHIPVPFEKGDLVEFFGDSYNDGPYVLRDLPHWQPNYAKRLSGEMSDGSDMIAWVNFMDEEGQLNFNDSPCFLYELKYYTDECKGYDRFLPYLSYYIKENKESIDVLIHSYSKIKVLTEYEKRISFLDNEFNWWTKLIEEATKTQNIPHGGD